LKILEGRIAKGEPITARTGKVLINELLDDYVTRYKVKRRITDDKDPRLRWHVLCRLKHIRPYLGEKRVADVTESVLTEYCQYRQQEGAANQTINLELAAIKSAFRLAYPGKVAVIPKIEMLEVDNERDGFIDADEFAAVLRHCHALASAILRVAHITGWRIKSIMHLEWRQVDLKNGWVWLEANQTKNRFAVRWPLMAGLAEVFADRRRITDEVERCKGMVIPYVFHREGKPARSIRKTWENARVKAGLPQRVIHDFRGTATVNLLEAGVDLPKVMGMVGFKSLQMVNRYAKKRGLRESSLKEAAAMLENRLEKSLGITKSITMPSFDATK
jgi:integrase